MKQLLIGNGFNIHIEEEYLKKEVSNYKNHMILKRVNDNLKTVKYYEMMDKYGNTANQNELINSINHFSLKFVEFIDEIFNDHKLTYSLNDKDDKEKEKDFQRVYSKYQKNKKYYCIGMEDYFFVLKLFCNKYFSSDLYYDLFIFIQWIFLDSIYHKGCINELHMQISNNDKEKYSRWFNSYNQLFTVNYDNNVEAISKNKVKYLHGDFKTLRDEYNINTFIGKSLKDNDEFYNIENGNEHLFCTAIMGHNGFYKENQIFRTKVIDLELGRIFGKLNQVGVKRKTMVGRIEKRIQLMKYKQNNKRLYSYYKNRFDMMMNEYYEYYLEDIESIEGELDIIGMSPFNDDHIWRRIIQNNKLKINYYYIEKYKDDEIKALKLLLLKYKVDNKKIEYYNVNEIWSKIH